MNSTEGTFPLKFLTRRQRSTTRPVAGYRHGLMEGYGASTYGDAFADVYDEWYHDVSDVDATVATIARLAGDGRPSARVLELGVGTGRLALPLATTHRNEIAVVGIDASAAMLQRLRARDPDGLVEAHHGDMVGQLPEGPFDVVFVAYNTFFNLAGDGEQQRCFDAIATRLRAGGRFVIEAFVPSEPAPRGDDITVRSMTADRIVLSVTRHSPDEHRADGQFVEFSEANGVRLRPWSIRYASPDELDELARCAGFDLESRWEDMTGNAFNGDSQRHVSVYRYRGH